MGIFKSVLHGVLVAQLAFAPAFALAAPVDPAKKKAYSEAVTRAVFDFIVHQSSIVNTAKDFERYLLFGLKERDRKAIMAQLKTQKDFPTFQRAGTTLVLDSGLKRYELKWLAVGKHEFEINGVKWDYNTKQAFMPQYVKLEKALKAKKSAGFWRQQLLPEAEAVWFVPILMMMAGTAIGVVGSDIAAEGWCAGVDYFGGTTQKCVDLKRANEEAMFKDTPSLDAVANQVGSDNSNILAKYEAEEWKCPTNNDGQNREYRGRLRAVETKDGKTNPISNWFNVVVKFNPEGFPTDAIISRDDADPGNINPDSKSETSKLVVHIAFDPTKKKPISYRLPNPDFNPDKDLLGKPTLTLTPTMKLSPQQTESIEKAKDIVRYLNYRNYNCVAKQIEQNQQAGITSGSPALPGGEVKPATPAIQ